MIEVVDILPEPVAALRYLNATRRGGPEARFLPLERARVRGLPDGLDAIVAASDLQGVVQGHRTHPSTLLGVALAARLADLAEAGVLPSPARTAIILAGDLYSVPDADQRGGHGDVAGVWAAFAERFAWVVGVAGNHDDVTDVARSERVVVLDTDTVQFAGLRIGGVALIAGNPGRLGRRGEDDQLERIELVAAESDLLILHEGPAGAEDQPGSPRIRDALERHGVALTVCGHVHWPRPLAAHARGQIVNVDSRALVMTRA